MKVLLSSPTYFCLKIISNSLYRRRTLFFLGLGFLKILDSFVLSLGFRSVFPYVWETGRGVKIILFFFHLFLHCQISWFSNRKWPPSSWNGIWLFFPNENRWNCRDMCWYKNWKLICCFLRNRGIFYFACLLFFSPAASFRFLLITMPVYQWSHF